MFSIFKRNTIRSVDLEIKFHKQTNAYGEHGTMVVSHVKQGLREVAVRFVFVGLTTPPKLDHRMFTYLWEEARNQGYIPHEIKTYGRENEIDTSREVQQSTNIVTFDKAAYAAPQNL